MKNYGFKPPVITPDNYTVEDKRLGAVIIKPDGDWTDWLPTYEAQADKYETYGCTIWGSLNQIETLFKFQFKTEPNYDERYNYNLAEINPPGTDPQISYESLRKDGVIQGMLPLPDTYEEFCTPRPMENKYLVEGLNWVRQYAYGHDWVLTGNENEIERIAKLSSALFYSPVGISVTAWFEQNGVYVDNGMPNNHWCLLYKIDEKYLYVFDSYDHSKKLLPHSHKVSYAKRISLVKRPPPMDNWIIDILKKTLAAAKEILMSMLEIVKKTPVPESPELTDKQRLNKAILDSIGKDASPKNLAPQELSCSEGVSSILNSVFPEFPKEVLSTINLKIALDAFPKFKRVLIPSANCVIVSPRTDTTYGHAGFFIDSKNIVSNDSKTGLMQKNYTLDSWIVEMKDKRGLHLYIWQLV